MQSSGVLILSHCTFSFLEQITKLLEAKGLNSFILSSKPVKELDKRVQHLRAISQWSSITNSYELSWGDAELALQKLSGEGLKVIACISVWEGYRSLMSLINRQLGVQDLENHKIQLLMNKLELRQALRAGQLSQVSSFPLDRDNFDDIKLESLKQNKKKFIKPYRGIASFGTCLLTEDIEWERLEKVVNEWSNDSVFKSIFADRAPFMVEDFIEGIELSFEVIFVKKNPFILAVHEKIEVDQKQTTVLENACVCPPVNIDKVTLQKGMNWLKEVLNYLQISAGCFHIEAKCNNGHWEIIEMNPRVGGALISDSVRCFTAGYSILEAWIDSLIYESSLLTDEYDAEFVFDKLAELDMSSNGISPQDKATFFRVYFSGQGVVHKIIQRECIPAPEIVQIFSSRGDTFDSDDKENFAGQALWVMSYNEMLHNMVSLLNDSKYLIEISLQQSMPKDEAVYV